MKNQIISTFIVLILISIFLINIQKKSNLNKKEDYSIKEEINIKKRFNIFKWITEKEYRRSYLKVNLEK